MATAAFCPKCGEANAEKTNFCLNCGEQLTLEEETVAAAEPQPAPVVAAPAAAAAAQSVPAVAAPVGVNLPAKRDYTALRGVAALCKIISWVFVGLAVLQVIGGVIVLLNDFLVGLGVIVGALIVGAIGYVFWRIIAESILVILDIEDNTRQTAIAIAQRLK
jgi:hypothetical protein